MRLSLSGPFSNEASNILQQYIFPNFYTNQISIVFDENAKVEFSTSKLKVTVGISDSYIRIPSSNFSTEFNFEFHNGKSFEISGSLPFSSQYQHSIVISCVDEPTKYSPCTVTLGQGNYPLLGLSYTQTYGHLTIDNSNNFTSITLAQLSFFTPKSKIYTTHKFSLTKSTQNDGGYYVKPTNFEIEREFRLECETFSTNYINTLSAKDSSI